MKEIFLFGGTFDPVHDGHVHVIDLIKKHFNNSDIYIIPANNPRWKKPSANIKDRINMLKIAFKNYKNVHISLCEKNSQKSYTINTINYFAKKFPNKKFFILIGSDLLKDLKKWKNIEEINKKSTIICIKRPEENNIINNNAYLENNIKIINDNPIYISSEMIRNLQKILMPKEVLNYIEEKKIYFIKKIKKYYTRKRFKHAISVAKLSYKIAEKNKIENCYKCYISGLLHDITKKLSLTNQKKIVKDFLPQWNRKIHKNLYHQITGSIIAEKDFNIKDKEILDAIRFHTTGKKNFSPIGKILYIADNLDPLRGLRTKNLIKKSFKDFNIVYDYVVKKTAKKFKKNLI